MTRSSSADTDSVGRFLSHQHFRYPETGRIYGHILRTFQSSVIERSTGALSVLCNGPQNLGKIFPFLRWWAALKMKESQCHEHVRVIHPA